jgi:hypothetical protein
MTEIRITLADFRNSRSKVCKDARNLFFQRFGLDWRAFCQNGMTADELRVPGQHLDLINRLEESARERLGLTVPKENV